MMMNIMADDKMPTNETKYFQIEPELLLRKKFISIQASKKTSSNKFVLKTQQVTKIIGRNHYFDRVSRVS